jgi:hypothetical protein
MTSIPSLNVTPGTSFGNWLWPSRRRQLFCAASSSLKTIAGAVLFDRQPFDRIVRWRPVAKVLSMGLVVRKPFGNLASTFAVLRTRQRCSRVFGQTSPAAFQNPSAPSGMASRGGSASIDFDRRI